MTKHHDERWLWDEKFRTPGSHSITWGSKARNPREESAVRNWSRSCEGALLTDLLRLLSYSTQDNQQSGHYPQWSGTPSKANHQWKKWCVVYARARVCICGYVFLMLLLCSPNCLVFILFLKREREIKYEVGWLGRLRGSGRRWGREMVIWIYCIKNLFSIKKKMPHIVSIEIPFSLITLDCANKA